MNHPSSILYLISLGAYLTGSVNFSILLFKLLKKGDPRDRFSGNAGATNVYRQAGPAWAFSVLLLDLARAMTVAWMAFRWLPPPWVPWIAFTLILGNRYPLFHGFRGGKGVANYLGFSAYFSPVAALLATGAWAVAWRLTGQPFIGSTAMIFTLTVHMAVAFDCHPVAISGAILTAGFILWCHRANFRAFISGQSGK